MAKKSMINRELKRQQTVAKFAEKRAALKAVIANPNSSAESSRVMRAQPVCVIVAA